ncbi:acetyl-CoA carboxylase biotin carboxyl carrier protein [Lactococcus nasutitermitis]|uniref:Biotin carboxyl carrier protein of acetyl-CoA carboxylase n=1 Tax=Lactococcus nasutitermitis TaxID=1652957 RepID=A0ABV9J9S1_9LACT|nr:acetyl-CoA carboxylase biotin carboxyl carrier protein [Lactococcus nasutitermitis]
MNINEVKDLMKQFDASTLREFSYRTVEGELNFSKNEGQFLQASPVAAAAPVAVAPVSTVAPQAEIETPSTPEVSSSVAEGETVTSPLVGVIYLKASPDKAEFVKVGDTVKKGQTLLIIEAMKVMNEIPAPKDGVITEILVSAEEVVEFGQDLVRIK